METILKDIVNSLPFQDYALDIFSLLIPIRGGSRAAATSKMKCFVIIVNGWKPLPIIVLCHLEDFNFKIFQPTKLHAFL